MNRYTCSITGTKDDSDETINLGVQIRAESHTDARDTVWMVFEGLESMLGRYKWEIREFCLVKELEIE